MQTGKWTYRVTSSVAQRVAVSVTSRNKVPNDFIITANAFWASNTWSRSGAGGNQQVPKILVSLRKGDKTCLQLIAIFS